MTPRLCWPAGSVTVISKRARSWDWPQPVDAVGQHETGREHWQQALDIYAGLGLRPAARLRAP